MPLGDGETILRGPKVKCGEYRYALAENWKKWPDNVLCMSPLHYNWDGIMCKWRDLNLPFLNWRWTETFEISLALSSNKY